MMTSKRSVIGFAAACVLVVVVTVMSNEATSQFVRQSQWVLHSTGVRDKISEIRSQFLAAQNNLRTFHLTGKDFYLKGFEKANQELTNALSQVQILVKDNPVQSKNAIDLRKQVEDRQKLWKNSFSIFHANNWTVFRERLMDSGVEILDSKFYGTLLEMKNEEARLLENRIEKARADAERAHWIIWFGGGLAGVSILLATIVVRRDSRRREIAEAEMDRFFTISLDLLCISGMDGYFKRLSPSYEDVLGYTLKELYERPILDFIHPEDIERTQAEIEKQAQGHRVMSFENRYRCKDGSYKVLSWKSVPVGHLMYAVARDVTRERDFEADLVRAREAAQSAALAKAHFLANMSHEIRTPLNGIIGIADLLSQSQTSESQEKLISVMRNSSRALLGVVNDILDFSKIEVGAVKLDDMEFDIVDLIEKGMQIFELQASEKKITMRFEYDSTLPRRLRGDSGKIGQIVLNFLSNAIKFTQAGGVSLALQMEDSNATSAVIKISVIDTGVGISKDQQERLFNPFVQGDIATTAKLGGTGLGLSICKGLADLMGGQVGVESQVGQGSKFWCRIPLTIPKGDQFVVSKSMNSQKFKAPDEKVLDKRKRHPILVAEDDSINQFLIMTMMQTLGYPAVLAKNGAEAVQIFKDQPFDLVLMDQNMPILNGLEAAKAIRDLEKVSNQRVAIISFTAAILQADQKEEHLKFVDDFLIKPVTLEAVEMILEKWLPTDTPVVDLIQIAKLKEIEAMGNENLMRNLYKLFTSEMPQVMTGIRQSAELGDMDRLSRQAHGLKSNFASLGLSRLQQLAEKIEGVSDVQTASFLMHKIESEYLVAKEELIKHLGS